MSSSTAENGQRTDSVLEIENCPGETKIKSSMNQQLLG